MPNHWVWFSTLQELAEKLNISPLEIEAKFGSRLSANQSDEDCVVKITPAEKEWIEARCRRNNYVTSCSSCHRFLQQTDGKAICACSARTYQLQYQQEYELLLANIIRAQHNLSQLANNPFRQTRNGFGESGIIFGVIKLTIQKIGIAFSATTLATSLFLPATLLGGYIYYRGRKEEQLFLQEAEADLLDRQLNLFKNHRNSVQTRQAHFNHLLVHKQIKVDHTHVLEFKNSKPFFLTPKPQTKIKPAKEKRSILGNPISHFIGTSFTTWSLLESCIALGILSFIPGGILATLLVIGISLIVGGVFYHKRRQFLQNKIIFEKQMARITAFDSDVNHLTKTTQKTVTSINQPHPGLSAIRTSQQLLDTQESTSINDLSHSKNSTETKQQNSEPPKTSLQKSYSTPNLRFYPCSMREISEEEKKLALHNSENVFVR